jgi:hypothetical protein
VLTL